MTLKLVERLNLTPNLTQAPSYLIKLEADQALNYQSGDWVSIQGENCATLVTQILQRLNLNPNNLIELRRAGPVSIQQALSQHLELTLLDPALLNKLKRQHGFELWADRRAMQAYAQNKDILDLLDAFPQLIEMGEAFLQLLSPLAPRYYSIASSPQQNDKQIHIIYKHIEFERNQRLRQGVVSGYLSRAPLGQEIEADIKPNAQFKLPDHPATPIIMLAAGTGIAPFIGFMQERAQQNSGDNILFFGEKTQQNHFLCRQQLERWVAQQQLTLHTAFSRDQQQKFYVQDKLWQQRDAFIKSWQQGAQIYLCGDKQGFAAEVEMTIKRIWMQAFNYTQDQANETWQQSKKQQRIQLDVY